MEQTENPNAAQTNGNGSHLTFGRYLRNVRLERGLSIEDVMDETRISKYVIQQIEAENLKNLPEDVYLKGFLKAYAEAVGVDPFDVLERYKTALGLDEQSPAHVKRDGRAARQGSSAKLIVSSLIVLLAVAALIVFYKGNMAKTETEVKTISEPEPAPVVSETVPDPVTEKDVPPPVPEGGLHLEVICVEETTLKITADGGLPEEFALKPEDHIELKAEKMYTIMIDNACGVSLLFNGNPVPVPGKCGQTATIQLP